MSAAATEPPNWGADTPPKSGLDWGLIRRQITGIFRLEVRRNLFSRRSFALYFLAFAPLAFFLIWAVFEATTQFKGPAEAVAQVFAVMFVIYLRTIIFLSTLITFMSLFRSEILERSLHYYYLTPVRRWVLVSGKYVSALISSCIVFAISTTTLFLLTCLPWGPSETSRYLFLGPGMGHLVTYIGIAVLGCIGYGAVFLLFGLFFRNAIVPAAFLWLWESINFILPALLKKISVIHYLQSLYPVPVLEAIFDGRFVVSADPTPAWISVPGLVVFTVLVLTFAGWRAARMEISYGAD